MINTYQAQVATTGAMPNCTSVGTCAEQPLYTANTVQCAALDNQSIELAGSAHCSLHQHL
jgi:hypothetical protein